MGQNFEGVPEDKAKRLFEKIKEALRKGSDKKENPEEQKPEPPRHYLDTIEDADAKRENEERKRRGLPELF